MSPKRNPKSKRVHEPDSGKFISEDKINNLTPFGYNDDEGRQTGVYWLLAVVAVGVVFAYSQGSLPL